MNKKISILGFGSWGKALSSIITKNIKKKVNIWVRNKKKIPNLYSNNKLLNFSSDIEEIINNSEMIFFAVPSTIIPIILNKISFYILQKKKNINIIWSSKGFINISGKLIHNYILDTLCNININLAIISGPSFANEILLEKNTYVDLASNNLELSYNLKIILSSKTFKINFIDDIIGVQIGGIIKNIIAVTIGLCEGCNIGLNAQYAIITFAFKEMMYLGKHFGGKRKTFLGLSGIGDLILTCSTKQSRNKKMGYLLAKGFSLKEIKNSIQQSIESINTAYVLHDIISDNNFNLPIIKITSQIIKEKIPPYIGIEKILSLI